MRLWYNDGRDAWCDAETGLCGENGPTSVPTIGSPHHPHTNPANTTLEHATEALTRALARLSKEPMPTPLPLPLNPIDRFAFDVNADEFSPKSEPVGDLYPEAVKTLTQQGWKVMTWMGAQVARQHVGVGGLQMHRSFDVGDGGLPRVVYLRFRSEGAVSLFCGAYPDTIDLHKVPIQTASNTAKKLAERASREGI